MIWHCVVPSRELHSLAYVAVHSLRYEGAEICQQSAGVRTTSTRGHATAAMHPAQGICQASAWWSPTQALPSCTHCCMQVASSSQLERCQKEAQLLISGARKLPVDLLQQVSHLKASASPPAHACWQVPSQASCQRWPFSLQALVQLQPLPEAQDQCQISSQSLSPHMHALQEACQVHCLCRRPNNEDRPMICCDSCNGWFHYDCVGLPLPRGGAAAAHDFCCPLCRTQVPPGQSEHLCCNIRSRHSFNCRAVGQLLAWATTASLGWHGLARCW